MKYISAVIQMEATPAPLAERLERAARLVAAAASQGAQLIALPELFNTGYGYAQDNYSRAEPDDGPTPVWLQATAATLGIHLAGSFLRRTGSEIFNTLLLADPRGRTWLYDKSYPWGWERAYFRPGAGPVIAETGLGNIGLLLCWDIAHLDLWRAYAGRVDLILACSCPPDFPDPTYHFPDGQMLTPDDLGPMVKSVKHSGQLVFGDVFAQQTAWLGVPALNTVGAGHFVSTIPNPMGSFLSLLPGAPWLVKYLPQARQIRVACDLIPATKILDANGAPLAALTAAECDSFTTAEIILPASRPAPRGPQPASPLPKAAYFIADTMLPNLMLGQYRRGVNKHK